MQTRRRLFWLGAVLTAGALAGCGDCGGGDNDAATGSDAGRQDSATTGDAAGHDSSRPTDAAGRDTFRQDAAGRDNYQPPTDAAGRDNYQPPTDAAGRDNYQPPNDAAGRDNYQPPTDAGCSGTGSGQWMQVAGDVDELYPQRNGHRVVPFGGVFWMLPGASLRDIRSSGDGVAWPVEATLGYAFGSRDDAPALAYDGALWIIGGSTNTGATNDVWRSSDGRAWTNVKPNDSNGFESRGYPGLAVHDGKMWVVAGGSAQPGMPPSILNHADVWNSTDGLTWTRVKDDSGGFPGRNAACTLAFDSKLWVIGGQVTSVMQPVTYLGDVWSSPDGLTWTQAKPDDTTGFGRRAARSCAVFNNRMWVIGGVGTATFSDVWWSTDGATWTQSKADDSSAFGARSAHAVWSDGSYLYLHGGFNRQFNWNDAWRSPDGAAWTQITPEPDRFERRAGLVALNFNSKMWVFGGTSTNDVWSSNAGAAWMLEKPHETGSVLPALVDSCGLVYDSKMWIIGGSRSNAVYSSPDGVNWTAVKPNDGNGFTARKRLACAVHSGAMFVAGGENTAQESTNDVWSSTDGLNWTEVKPNDANGFTARTGHTLVSRGSALWIVGGDDYATGAFSDVWSSTDGATWTQVKANDASSFAARTEHVCLVKDNALWILGGGASANSTAAFNDVWTSTDGATWTRRQTADCSTMPARMSMGAVQMGISIFLIGGQATKSFSVQNVWNDVWAFTP